MLCPRCGTDNSPDSRFCLRCGATMSGSPPPPNYPVSSQAQYIPAAPSGLRQNWKLLVGVVALFFLMAGAAAFGLFAVVMSSLRNSDSAREAMSKARSNPAVAQRLGVPLKEGWLISGSFEVTGDSGSSHLALPISGPKGKATIYVTARKTAGEWKYTRMQVVVEGSEEKIDLLNASSGVEAALFNGISNLAAELGPHKIEFGPAILSPAMLAFAARANGHCTSQSNTPVTMWPECFICTNNR